MGLIHHIERWLEIGPDTVTFMGVRFPRAEFENYLRELADTMKKQKAERAPMCVVPDALDQ